jgi:hypothetical protein
LFQRRQHHPGAGPRGHPGCHQPDPALARVITIICSAKGCNDTNLRSCVGMSSNGGGAGMFQLGGKSSLFE